MRSNTATVLENQTCPHCKSTDLYIEPRPPHVALVCRSCGRWVRWVRKKKAKDFPPVKDSPSVLVPVSAAPTAYPKTPEQIRPDFSPSAPDGCPAEIAELKRLVDGHSRELTILVRAVLSCGMLRGKEFPPGIDIKDSLVDRLAREIEEEAK